MSVHRWFRRVDGVPWRRISGAALVVLFLAFAAQQYTYTQAAERRAADAKAQRDRTQDDVDRLREENDDLEDLLEGDIARSVCVDVVEAQLEVALGQGVILGLVSDREEQTLGMIQPSTQQAYDDAVARGVVAVIETQQVVDGTRCP